jgi:hypothetical protein
VTGACHRWQFYNVTGAGPQMAGLQCMPGTWPQMTVVQGHRLQVYSAWLEYGHRWQFYSVTGAGPQMAIFRSTAVQLE